jgi:hypothetical protein
LAFTPENAVLVTVKGNGLAVCLQIGTGRPEVIECRLRGNETKLHQTTRRIVDECQQRAGLTARLEPGMLRAVDLHQFAETVPPPARLMRRRQPVTAINPQSIGDHPAAQRLMRNRAAIMLRQLLRRECRTEVHIPLAHNR